MDSLTGCRGQSCWLLYSLIICQSVSSPSELLSQAVIHCGRGRQTVCFGDFLCKRALLEAEVCVSAWRVVILDYVKVGLCIVTKLQEKVILFESQLISIDSCHCANHCVTFWFVVWPTTSCYADWSKRDHVTLVIIGRCTLERLTVQHFSIALQCCICNIFP